MTDTRTEADWGPLATPPHTGTTDDPRPWRDNAFFCFWDLERELYGAVHVSTSPQDVTGRRARATVQHGNRQVELIEQLPVGSWTGHQIRFDASTRAQVDGPGLSGWLTGTPLHPAAVFAGDDTVATLSLDSDRPVQHHQRSARVRGELVVDGEHLLVDGHGYRDRSWGFRDESATMREYVGLMWVFEQLSISALKLALPNGGEAVVGHVLHAGGTTEPVRELAIVRDAAGHLTEAVIETAAGRRFAVTSTRRTATMSCPMGADRQSAPTLSAYDQFDHLVLNDGSPGFGLTEQGIRRNVC